MLRTGFLLALALTAALPARASVSENNGNFFIGYTDVGAFPGIGMKLERVYNSKSSFNGLFGFGWGSDYEIYLSVQADGSVVVHENGGGSQATFSPPAPDAAAIRLTVDNLTAARGREHDLTQTQLAGYHQRVTTDERFRHDEWERLRLAAGLQPRQVAAGTKLTSMKWGYQELLRTQDGYDRTSGDEVWHFGDDGKLVSVRNRDGHSIRVAYDRAGRIQKVSDDLGHAISFDLSPSRHLVRAVVDGKVIRYRYVGDQLVYSHDFSGNEYHYQYDDRFSLTRIGYADGSELNVAYDPYELNENTRLVRNRDGAVTLYKRLGGTDPGALEYGNAVEERGPDGKVTSSHRQLFVQRVKSDGTGRYLYHEMRDEDGQHSESTYDEHGRPLEVLRGGQRAAFKYDAEGRPTYREDENGVQELAYADIGKVSSARIAAREKGALVEKVNAAYRYDPKGNLVEAKTADGRSITLTYDAQGRIDTMNVAKPAEAGQQVHFQYNETNWKPAQIEVPGVGAITVTYNGDGGIEKVDSPAGRDVSLKVTTAFQALIDILRPAGVSF